MNNFLNGILKSWKTTIGGLIAFLAILWPEVMTLLDNDVFTNPNWNLIVAEFGIFYALLFARDNDVTSEDAGASGEVEKTDNVEPVDKIEK